MCVEVTLNILKCVGIFNSISQRPVCLIGVWLHEDKRTKHMKATCLIEIRLCLHEVLHTPQ